MYTDALKSDLESVPGYSVLYSYRRNLYTLLHMEVKVESWLLTKRVRHPTHGVIFIIIKTFQMKKETVLTERVRKTFCSK